MQLASLQAGLILALALPMTALAQEANGDIPAQDQIGQTRTPATDNRIHLRYGVFDPVQETPMVPANLLAGPGVNLYIVQYSYAFIDADRDALRAVGATLHAPIPHNGLIVRMSAAQAATVQAIEGVRWVGHYQPAYRLEGELITEIAAGLAMPAREYNMVMADKRNDKNVLDANIRALGGKVTDRHNGGLLFTAELTKPQLIQAAGLDEVLWIDQKTADEEDMNNARIVQGANYVETSGGYNGTSSIRGHVYEGVEFNHPDFTFPMINVRSGGQPARHGHCTAGIIFGNGNSSPSARGMSPQSRGYYTTYTSVTAGWSRNMVIDDVVNVHNCLFTTASWGGARTTLYTSVSADSDDVVFDHRIPWTQSQSNAGNQNSRPQAWAKNVISVGGMRHYDNTNPGDDRWNNGASIGPAADNRIKPDLCNFYDSIWTSDLRAGVPNNDPTRPGTFGGYSSGNSTTTFGGTSGATPVTAGLNALAIEMYTNHIFPNKRRVSGGSRFANRPYAQTLKALQIANASLYAWGTGAGQAIRNYQGWGYGNLRTLYDNRNNMLIIPETKPIQQGQTHTYYVNVTPGTSMLKMCMTFLDPAGAVSPALSRVNNLNMQVRRPNGLLYWGNNGLKTGNTSLVGGGSDLIDTVECFVMPNPQAGQWRIQITAPLVAQDANPATNDTDATYALVVAGGTQTYDGCARYIPGDENPSQGTVNVLPFGTSGGGNNLQTVFASNNGGSVGGAVYFDVTGNDICYVNGISVNTATAAGTPITADIYYTPLAGTYVGNETNMGYFTHWTVAKGVSAGIDTPSVLKFNRGIYIGNGFTYAWAVAARDFGHRYTNGANSYSNSHLTIDTGSATNVPFTGNVFNPRSANITLNYRVDDSSWHNNIYQQVLRCEDLGPAGNITGLAFAPTTSGRHYNRYLRIRMAHKPAGYNLSTTFATNITGSTTVLNENYYSWNVQSGQYNEVGLTGSFAYNGTQDVVVEIQARGNHMMEGSSGGFRRGPENRLYATGWQWNAVPTTGTLGLFGTKIRAEFSCEEAGEFGTSCGPTRADHFGSSDPGSTFWYDLFDAVPNSGAVISLGFNQTNTSLTGSGFPGCWAWNDNIASVFKVVSNGGFATHSIAIPNTSVYNGLIIYGHWYNFDSNAPGDLTVSDYIRMIIGESP